MAAAYFILAAGAFISYNTLQRQTDRLDRHTQALEKQAKELKRGIVVFCEVSRKGDKGEETALLAIAAGKTLKVDPVCLAVLKRLTR